MLKKCFSLAFLMFLASGLPVQPLLAGETVVFGPVRYERAWGKPETVATEFTGPKSGSGYRMEIQNGDMRGRHRVTSGTVTLNGRKVVGSRDFKRHAARIVRAVSLESSNELRVSLGGRPGDFVTITILGPDEGPTVSLSASPESIVAGGSSTLTWSSSGALACAIDQGVGSVPLEGSITVSPGQTTTYTITAGGPGGTSTASATVSVRSVAPVANDDRAATPEDTPVVLDLLANDSGSRLSVSSVTQGGHGLVSMNPDGTVTYAPAADFNGEDAFTYKVEDSQGATATGRATVTVHPVNDPPEAVDDAGTTSQGKAVVMAVLTNDGDPDGDPLQVSAFTQGIHGSVVAGGNDTLVYTPTAGFSGEDDFSYTVSDGNGGNASGTVRVAVNPLSSIALGVTSPLEGELITGASVMVLGTVTNSAGNETGVTVNGVVARVHGDVFVANHVPLNKGENTIIVRATDACGNSATASFAVSADPPTEYLEIAADVESGISPLELTLTVRGSFGFNDSTLADSGPGPVEMVKRSPEEYGIRLSGEGIYYFTAGAANSQGIVCEDTAAIVVLNRDELDSLIKTKWNGMKSALIRSDIQGALDFFLETSRERYGEAFHHLGAELPGLASEMREIQLVYARDRIAKYRIRREEEARGQIHEITYFIAFVRDPFGIWHIESF